MPTFSFLLLSRLCSLLFGNKKGHIEYALDEIYQKLETRSNAI